MTESERSIVSSCIVIVEWISWLYNSTTPTIYERAPDYFSICVIAEYKLLHISLKHRLFDIIPFRTTLPR